MVIFVPADTLNPGNIAEDTSLTQKLYFSTFLPPWLQTDAFKAVPAL